MRGAKHVFNLVLYHAFDSRTCRAQVLTRVEFARVFGEEFANRCGHGQAEVCVDVDLADSHFSCFAKHVFWYTLGTWDVTTVFVAFSYELREDRGSTM